MIETGILIDGRYEVLNHLGDGGMGTVFKAREAELERIVAIKFLHSDLLHAGEQRARFDREGKVLSTISHPNLLSCYRFGIWQQKPYIVMEYLEGRSLRQILSGSAQGLSTLDPVVASREKDTCPLEWRRAVRIGISICEGMQYAHSRGIIHRDLKPNNIVLTGPEENELVKVVDFGLARVLDDSGKVNQHLTQTGAVLGTLFYLSPEQCSGQKADYRSDIYALGCLLYEIVSGEPPFYSDNPIAIMQKHVAEPAPLLTSRCKKGSCPPELDGIVLKALAKDPATRYQTMDDLKKDLEHLLNGRLDEIEAKAPSTIKARAGRVLAVAAAASLILCGTAGLVWLNSEDGIAAMVTMRVAGTAKGNAVDFMLARAAELRSKNPKASAKILESALQRSRSGVPDMTTASILTSLGEVYEMLGRKSEAILSEEDAINIVSSQIMARADAQAREKELIERACRVLRNAGVSYNAEYKRFHDKHREWYRTHSSMLDKSFLEQKASRCELSLINLYRGTYKKVSSLRAAILELALPPAGSKDQFYKSFILQILAETKAEAGYMEQSDQYFDAGKQILASFTPPVPYALADLLASQGEQLCRQERTAEAWALNEQAREILSSNKMPPVEGFIDYGLKDAAESLGQTRMRIGDFLLRTGDLTGAREQFVAAVATVEPIIYEVSESRLIQLYSSAADLLARNGQHAEAVSMLERGLRAGIAKRRTRFIDGTKGEISYNPTEGAFHAIIGQLEWERGNFQVGELEFKRALDLLNHSFESKSEAVANSARLAWSGLTDCLIKQQKYEEAAKLIEQIRESGEKSAVEEGLANILLARLSLYRGDFAKAQRLVEISSKVDKKRSSGIGLAGLALVRDCLLMSRSSLALRFEAQLRYPRHPDQPNPAAIRAGLDIASADACIGMKKYESAKVELDHASTVLNKYNKGATTELCMLYASTYTFKILSADAVQQSDAAEQALAKAESFAGGDCRQTLRLKLEIARQKIFPLLFSGNQTACDQALALQELNWQKVPGAQLEAAKSYFLISKFARGTQRERYRKKASELYGKVLGENHPTATRDDPP